MTEQERIFKHRPITHVPKPWGYELIFAQTDRYVGKILHINQGESLSLQYHEMKEETLYVVDGELTLTIECDGDRRELPLRKGEAFHIPPRLIHPAVGRSVEPGVDAPPPPAPRDRRSAGVRSRPRTGRPRASRAPRSAAARGCPGATGAHGGCRP